MIVLFTDFGPAGPYVGQMKAMLASIAPNIPVIDLLSNAPAFNPGACSYLLAALSTEFPAGAVFLGVVDPGVGGARAPVVVKANAQWFVGPENGLFATVARRADDLAAWRITYRPERLSASFHGRDLFSPVAARIATGEPVPGDPVPPETVLRTDWPDDLAEVVYIDYFGNAMTGLRAASLPPDTALEASGRRFNAARVFSDVAPGAAFWYENANGLAEIAVNRGRADEFGIKVGTPVTIAAANGSIPSRDGQN